MSKAAAAATKTSNRAPITSTRQEFATHSPLYFALPSRRLLLDALDAADALAALAGTAMAVKRKTDSSAATVAQKKSRTGT
jgi:hypothetical protein